ncbi:MAG: type IV toxin-antitoxin system AbiEi family antitoxin domain-containing protein [Myxococcota bacterium]
MRAPRVQRPRISCRRPVHTRLDGDPCPTLTQQLLENCDSVKAKRLFLFLARRTRRPWFRALHPRRLDLGSGPRQVVRGGKLDKTHKITVPRELEK